MSWLDGIVHTKNYEHKKKFEKQLMESIEKMGELLGLVDQIAKELRFYALEMKWFDGSTSIIDIPSNFHFHTTEHYEKTREMIIRRLNEGDRVFRLNQDQINKIKEMEKKNEL